MKGEVVPQVVRRRIFERRTDDGIVGIQTRPGGVHTMGFGGDFSSRPAVEDTVLPLYEIRERRSGDHPRIKQSSFLAGRLPDRLDESQRLHLVHFPPLLEEAPVPGGFQQNQPERQWQHRGNQQRRDEFPAKSWRSNPHRAQLTRPRASRQNHLIRQSSPGMMVTVSLTPQAERSAWTPASKAASFPPDPAVTETWAGAASQNAGASRPAR